jgi:hypothetical protein
MKAVFRIRIRIDFGRLEPDPDPGEQKLPTKIEKKLCFEVLDVLFRRQKASPVAWTWYEGLEKAIFIKNIFFYCKFCTIFGLKKP